MTEEDFWALINKADMDLVDQEDCGGGVAPIVEALSNHTPDGIRDFHEIMSQKLYALDHIVLSDELDSGDDSFLYQRCYIVASGHKKYKAVFDEGQAGIGDLDWCESLIYVAQEAWTKSQDTEWEFEANVSYETGSNRDGYIEGAKLVYQGIDIVELYSPDSPAQNDTIEQAIKSKDFNLASSMIRNGADVNHHNPLYAAVDAKNDDLVERLIAKGADVNQPNVEGGGCYVTPLEVAVSRNKIGIAKMLLAAGASPVATRKHEFCPLQTACDRGNMKMAKLLLDAGADPDTQIPGGQSDLKQGSPLFSAVNSEKPAMVELVLSYGANPEVLNENVKYTPLVSAYLGDDLEVMRVLLNGGADVNTRFGLSQRTILQSALDDSYVKATSEKGKIRRRIAKLMLEYGAKLPDGSIPEID